MKCLVIMDPIEHIKPWKDTSFAMMLEMQKRGYEIQNADTTDLFIQKHEVWVRATTVDSLRDVREDYVSLGSENTLRVADFNLVLMRKDPPFNMQYIYATYLLEMSGARVFNRPSSIRDANEKLFAQQFAGFCPETLVTASKELFDAFVEQHANVICKPLDGMGGRSISRVNKQDDKRHDVFNTLTAHGTYAMFQRFIPDIVETGDKRILMVDGKAIPFALARVPAEGCYLGNLAAGGTGHVVPLTEREREVCEHIGPVLRAKGLIFVGVDMIGGYLTEINVTSPTCAREITAGSDFDVCKIFLDAIE